MLRNDQKKIGHEKHEKHKKKRKVSIARRSLGFLVPFCAFLCFSWPTFLASGAEEPATEQVVKSGNAVARAAVDRAALDLSGELTVTVSVEGKAPLEIEPLKAITLSRAWVALPPAAPQTKTLPGGRMHWQQAFRLTPLQDGKVELPLEPLHFRANAGDTERVSWKPFSVQVSTVVSSTSLSALKDITPPEQVPAAPVFPWLPVTVGLVASPVLALVGWGAWRATRRPPAPPRELTPVEWAEQALGRLDVGGETFHLLLADVLRGYLQRRFAVATAERTSGELLAALRQQGCLTPESEATLRALLERCDLAKFARVTFARDVCQQSVVKARELVRDTAPAPDASAKRRES